MHHGVEREKPSRASHFSVMRIQRSEFRVAEETAVCEAECWSRRSCAEGKIEKSAKGPGQSKSVA